MSCSFSEVPYADHALKRGSTKTECCIGLSAVPQRRRGSTGGPYDGWSNNALVVRDRIKALETLCFKGHIPLTIDPVQISKRPHLPYFHKLLNMPLPDFTRVVKEQPYLHLVLGLVNDVVKEMLADLAKLSCVDFLTLERQRERQTTLEDLEGRIGEAVGELVACLGPKERKMVSEMVRGMVEVAEDTDVVGDQAQQEEKEAREAEEARVAAEQAAADHWAEAEAGRDLVPEDEGEVDEEEPALGGKVAAPTGGYVAAGELAAADWSKLLASALASAEKKVQDAQKRTETWRPAAAGDDSGPAKRRRVAQSEQQRLWSDYAQKIEDKALLESNEIKGLIRNVEKAIDAHDAYDTEVEQSADNVNEGALVALMMDACAGQARDQRSALLEWRAGGARLPAPSRDAQGDSRGHPQGHGGGAVRRL